MLPADAPSGFRRVALIVACALFMQNLDATVLATVLPTMAREFHVSPAQISLALTGYLLALAVFIPASGPLADRFGARRTFQAAIALFVAGSIFCGMATGLTSLVVARVVQGVGGALMVPVGRLVLLRTVRKHELVAAIAWLTMPAMLGPILGPPVGGAIVTWLDWRWIFWINLPMGLFGIAMVGRYIAEHAVAEAAPFDLAGFILCGFTLAPLIFGLQLAGRSVHPMIGAGLIGAGLLSGFAYVRHARRADAPVLDLSLLRISTFRRSLIGGSLTRITQGAMPFLMPMLLQLTFGLSAAASGTVTFASALGAFTMKSVAPKILRRVGFRTTLMVVGVASPLFYAMTGLIRHAWPMPAIFVLLLCCGFLVSLQFTAFNAIAYADIEPEQMSRATSFYATFQQLSLSVGICAAATSLGISMRLGGRAVPTFADFGAAIWTVTGLSLLAIFNNRGFAFGDGAEMSRPAFPATERRAG
ncbi:MFS transporter [Novosphingobium flavum]|uniref:MFS transporter n=1 Tax=Novosphingobium flavum TaxID=1778672 RepID=A0A7X1FPY2_9SPHN|nr:MFS transporter [Novosphingobium flavum]MBC2664810.1 MFS transporter [Novosphingobium flavum]